MYKNTKCFETIVKFEIIYVYNRKKNSNVFASKNADWFNIKTVLIYLLCIIYYAFKFDLWMLF